MERLFSFTHQSTGDSREGGEEPPSASSSLATPTAVRDRWHRHPERFRRPLQHHGEIPQFQFVQLSNMPFRPLAMSGTGPQAAPDRRKQLRPHQFQSTNYAELCYLLQQWQTPEFRKLVTSTLPSLGRLLQNDQEFLHILTLGRLSDSDPEAQPSPERSSASSWGSPTLGQQRASDLHLETIYRRIASSTRLTATAYILGLKLVHCYKTLVHGRAAPPASAITNHYHLVIVGLMLANKYTEDRPYPNKSWSSIYGLDLSHINRLEAEFLRTLEHRMYIEEEEFKEWTLCLSRLCGWMPAHAREAQAPGTGSKGAAQQPVEGRRPPNSIEPPGQPTRKPGPDDVL